MALARETPVDFDSELWKKVQDESPCTMKYHSRNYVQSKCGKYWYSRDNAKHAGSAFKRYTNKKNELIFKDSLDGKMRPMTKNDSKKGTSIEKSKMVGVGGKK